MNDDVMGGVSVGSPARNKQNHNLKFWGALSMENHGGFATIRTDVKPDVFQNSVGIRIKECNHI